MCHSINTQSESNQIDNTILTVMNAHTNQTQAKQSPITQTQKNIQHKKQMKFTAVVSHNY